MSETLVKISEIRTSKKKILIFLEKRCGSFTKLSMEIAGGAVNLAEKSGCELSAVVIDGSTEEMLPALSDEIIRVIEAFAPNLVLTESGPAALGMAASLAARLDAGLLSGCDGIEYSDDKGFCPVRPNASGTRRLEFSGEEPLIVPIRPGTFSEINQKEIFSRISELTEIKNDGNAIHKAIQLVETIYEKKQDIDISKARILVAGGRGVGSPEGFSQLKVLADLLGGEVAASRALVELGWANPSMQVGQTGKTVAAELYIACGISGAIQHVTGMKDSKLIIAVNKNPAAPIFEAADLGIVGNLENIIPAVIKALREKKGDTNAV